MSKRNPGRCKPRANSGSNVLVAEDDDPQWVDRLARTRWVVEQLRGCEVMVFADELDLH
jgi:hypothetical protein